ncbi:VWA domain-containing protein [Nodosilinea sp. LEGE 07088]|uniref:vWA domain-containing protein n=1 Tax=Nodosilinea sp. LEGE 07088 TaxID=2777968 RepID=UPI00187E7E3D|nr:vWA domain-containing protein [Nodosilinea sp. LEGE 07088]MBE9138343.1 VWA domain-containing protein [Nodosilinea sp. LEGE 07088]
MKPRRFKLWLGVGLCLSGLWACSSLLLTSSGSIQSFESADRYLHQRLLPNIQVESQLVSDTAAYNAVIPPLADAVPDPDAYPLYGAQPTSDTEVVYIEIYSSAEKANGSRADERWLVDVAEAFNQQRQTISSGQVIQVGVRNIPSGLGAQILAAGKGKPAGYTPAHGLWLELLKADGIVTTPIAPALVANQAIFALQPQVYEALAEAGEVTFDRVVAAILAGEFEVGFCNPYIASPAINFLYTLLWRAAGHDQTGAPLLVEDLDDPAVNSVFAAFQQQIALTTPTYLDLKQIWQQDPDAFQAIVMSRQSFVNLKKEPEFAQLAEVPFGVPETSPLVAFNWTSPTEREALKAFAAFATTAPMQQLAVQQGHIQTDYLQQGDFPPLPSGEVLKAAQTFWKQRKDGGRTVYMELVVDTSGSMDQNNRLKAVQEALRFASQQINPGNQIGLVTFSDRPIRRIHLAPFNELEQKRLFTAIDQLQPDGSTALYDGVAVALAELMEKQKTDPDGQFYLLLLTDGDRTDGLTLNQIQAVIQQSGVRVYPIAYGEVNHRELAAIAALREGAVYEGTPERVQVLLQDLFQTNL